MYGPVSACRLNIKITMLVVTMELRIEREQAMLELTPPEVIIPHVKEAPIWLKRLVWQHGLLPVLVYV